MRVAVLASGFLHGAPESAENFRKCVLEPLNADLFVFTSRENVVRDERGRKSPTWLTSSDQQKFLQAMMPHLKKFRFTEDDPRYFAELGHRLETYDAHLREKFRPRCPPEYVAHEFRMSCIDQYLRLALCWNLMLSWISDYDVVVRARPDLVFEGPLKIKRTDEDVLYVPCKEAFYSSETSATYLKEFLFWGNKNSMGKICSNLAYAYGIPEPFFEPGGSDYTLCPEHQFGLYVKERELQVEFVPLTVRYSEEHRAYLVVEGPKVDGPDRVQL